MENTTTLNTKPKLLTTRTLVLIALFAALVYVTTYIRIEMPAIDGKPFFHFGNSMVALATLLLGYRRGMLAGIIGFALFDCINGYANVFYLISIETFFVCSAYALVFQVILKKKDDKINILLTLIIGVIVKLICSYTSEWLQLVVKGTDFTIAANISATSLLVTTLNGIGTIFVVSLLYPVLKNAMQKTVLKSIRL